MRTRDVTIPLALWICAAVCAHFLFGAAFRAAEEKRSMNMSDLILGVKSEMRKEGKLCTKSDFGPHYEMIQREGTQ